MRDNLEELLRKTEELAIRLSSRIPGLRTVMEKQYYLKSFVCVAVLMVSFICFNLAFLGAFSVYQGVYERRAHELSNVVSGQYFHTLYVLMEKGATRKELEEYMASVNSGRTGADVYQVEFFRNGKEADVSGSQSKAPPEEIREVFRTGSPLDVKTGYVFADIYPVKAGGECLRCHTDVKSGDILGAVSIRQDMGPVIGEVKRKLAYYMLFLSPVPFLLAGLIATFLNARIRRSTEQFHSRIRDVSSVKDLTKLDMKTSGLEFVEFNDMLVEINEFAGRMKDVAVDRRILEFELEVLGKFIITSEVVRDWKEHILNLLVEINKVIDAYAIFSVFQVDEEAYDLEVFWLNRPSDATRERLERIIRDKLIMENERMSEIADIRITHNTGDVAWELPELGDKDIELQTKTLILQNPKIGGVVGIGVQSVPTDDTIRSIVIDGILTTLLNVVGSIKAIYKYTREIEFYATRDPLTDLFNQRMFWELLGYEVGRAFRKGYKFSLIVVDLDNFKNINDTHGHIVGDKFLTQISTRMQDALRQGDIIARYGGDEFAVILPDADKEQAFLVANRIKDNTGGFFLETLDGSQVRTTVSLGLTVYPDHADNAKDLFMFADNMMYKAKIEGKNTVSYPTEEDMVEVYRKAGEKSAVVMQALEEKAIIPFFQPIINCLTGEIDCHEVLSRIRTDKGMMVAGEFIDIAERLGVVSRLDYILMEKVFQKVSVEQYSGYLFMNLSPKSLILKEFLPTILKLSREYGIDNSRIVFEITERDTVRNMSLLETFVHNIKFEGFKFAIDDFGSGFSSFYYIKRFPIDFVKIEGEFIKNIRKDSKDLAFVKTMGTLAREFGIKSVAEYIEDEEIYDIVKQIGLDYGQGYRIGKPSADFVKKRL